MSNTDYKAGEKIGIQKALQLAVEACESTCGKWMTTKETTVSGIKIHVCPCAEAIKKIPGYKP